MTIAAVVISAVGCSTSGGSTSPASKSGGQAPAPSSSTNTGGLPGPGVPKVADPITNTQPGQKDPCSLLTDSQLKEYLGEAPKGEPDLKYAVGPKCQWQASSGTPIITINWTTSNKRGMTDIYSIKDRWTSFAPTTISGYPGADIIVASSDKGHNCMTTFGVTDQLTISVQVEIGEKKVGKLDPCKDGSEPVAKLVLANIKKQGS